MMAEAQVEELIEAVRSVPQEIRIEPPPVSGITIEEEDSLYIRTWSSIASPLLLKGRVRLPGGKTKKIRLDHTPNADRTSAFDILDLAKYKGGVLESVTVVSTATDPEIDRGRIWTQIGIAEGIFTTFSEERISAILGQDYSYGRGSIAWPPAKILSPLEGRGFLRGVSLGDPAAGSDYTAEAVPDGALWRVISVRGILVNSASGGNRKPRMTWTDGTDTLGGAGSYRNIGANVTIRYSWESGLGGIEAGSGLQGNEEYVIPIPEDLYLGGAFTLAFSTIGLLAGDDWGEGFVFVEEWISP